MTFEKKKIFANKLIYIYMDIIMNLFSVKYDPDFVPHVESFR